jgi:hypothetical protein
MFAFLKLKLHFAEHIDGLKEMIKENDQSKIHPVIFFYIYYFLFFIFLSKEVQFRISV